MEEIRREELEEAFSHGYRQYLTGRLALPQPYLRHFDDDIEIGISDYPEFRADVPHVHPIATEHVYVLSGAVRIRFFGTEAGDAEYRAGDFVLIRPGVPHASKNAPGTRVLFVKSPGGNDKTVFRVGADTREWLSAWDVPLSDAPADEPRS